MSNRDTQLNRFLLDSYQQIVADIPAERLGEPAPGGGHPPVWVLGHLAICAELGLASFGDEMAHPEWLEKFGPGSSDQIQNADEYSFDVFDQVILEGYPKLAKACAEASSDDMSVPHGIDFLEGGAIATRGDLMSHLLTSHFGFHLAQLSHWRRAAGNAPLF
ncbi:DinB family protein [Planctomycetes bacterium K23_9]|uniref:Uncharacterized protein n=1 Tax=Stieleria marina TaxID=1930275 RepID=A0A517NS88_9BACT|nr:hypothetical protein K239x_19440 [Planctomycetes bacterium K23_9]